MSLLLALFFSCCGLAASFIDITLNTSSQQHFAVPESIYYPQQVSLVARLVGSHHPNSNKAYDAYCEPPSAKDTQHINGSIVISERPMKCTVLEHSEYLRSAGAVGFILFHPGYEQLPGFYWLGDYETLQTFQDIPGINVRRSAGRAMIAAIEAEGFVQIVVNATAADNPWMQYCAPTGISTLLVQGVMTVVQAGLFLLACYRWWRFVQAKGLEASLAQATLANTLLMCAVRTASIAPEGGSCGRMGHRILFLSNLLMSLPLPLLVSNTLAISFYFKGVVGARKGQSPMQRYRLHLRALMAAVLLVDVAGVILRVLIGSLGSMLSAGMYVIIIPTLAVFFATNSLRVLTAIRNSSAATVTSPTNAKGGNGSGGERAKAPRMARWLLATAFLLLLSVLSAALFTLNVYRWSPLALMLTWLLYWVCHSSLNLCYIMVFALPPNRARTHAYNTTLVTQNSSRRR